MVTGDVLDMDIEAAVRQRYSRAAGATEAELSTKGADYDVTTESSGPACGETGGCC
jgi:hypothetical protein